MSDKDPVRPAVRAPVYGGRFMVVTGHMAASVAALNAQARGGNVVDAAIAASAALAAVVGQATTIGGDCFVLYHDAGSGKTHGLNACGVAPAAAVPDRFPDGMKVLGPLACVVPGLVAAWDALHRAYGSLSWSELLDDAIWIADGHPVSFILASRYGDAKEALAADPGCAGVFLPGGQPVASGQTLHQPALARTLKIISEDGAGAFYHGEIAAKIAAGFERAGGLITAADLAAYQPMWVEPMSTAYRGHRVSVMPPNSCGGLLLMQLDGLSA
ncbi:MAG: gamma-glutamyltransferase, partial [Hyphomicrobiaceae bacterium]